MWIPITEQEPEMEVEILLWAESTDGDGYCYLGELDSKTVRKDKTMHDFRDAMHNTIENVTHWQPLPEAPNN
ncbi:MAG: DUF551 domain-containing protein [Sphaerochaetaceae bacterium]|nr:DUF551 domain-containing protein [Sphaerochaetaceae bacterium]